MKKTTIRHLVALGVMLGVGGCKAQEATTKCDYSQAQPYATCDGCNTVVCELITGQEFTYLGFFNNSRHSFSNYPTTGSLTSLIVCDSTNLKQVLLKVGKKYSIDYNRKLGCKVGITTSQTPSETHWADIIKITDKSN